MRLLLVAAAVLLVVLIGLLLISRTRQRDAVQDARAPASKLNDAYVSLRNQALALGPEDVGVQATQADPPTVYGVVMETGYPEGAATLVSLASGDASLYLSGGGGVIGGIAHDAVRSATAEQIAAAQAQLPRLHATSQFPLPRQGQTTFYVLTTKGVVTADAPERQLGENKHTLSPLFHAGHGVITELRLISERQDAAR